jgi:fibronectin-binding autotransporter adhesin
MNRIHRVLWCEARRAWVVASELSKARGKRPRSRSRVAPTLTARFLLSGAALLAWPAASADLYWDADGGGVNLGGAGTWNLTSPFWNTSGNAAAGPFTVWNNGNLDNAIFQGTAATVTLGVPITVHNLTFNVHNYTLTGSTLTLAGTAPTIHNPGNTTINSIVAGTAGLTKTGTGALTLGGINTFSGGIALNAGALLAATDAALGAASNNIVTAAGTSVRLGISGATNTSRMVTIGTGGTLTLEGAAVGSALITGDGNLNLATGLTLSNDNNSYTGTTRFNSCNGVCSTYFTSIADLGLPSALGAPTTVENGTILFAQSSQYSDNAIYIGTGHSSNRNWSLLGDAAVIRNQGTGTLTLTGNISSTVGAAFAADDADIALLGVLSGNNYSFNGNAGRTITLAGANTYTGATVVSGVTVLVPVLADAGVNSSFGAGTQVNLGASGVVSYTGAGTTTDRTWIPQGAASILNDGTGALTLSGDLSFVAGNPVDQLTLGGTFGGINTFSGVISGAGNLIGNGAGTWTLSAANTHTGTVTVESGTLQAGNAQALGTPTGVIVNGGTLDLNDHDFEFPTLEGTGGNVDLGTGNLTLSPGSGNADGAELIEGGHRESGGYFVEPTVFRNVPPSARIAQEEIFGPVLAVIPFDDIQDAIRIANDTRYGLLAYAWTASLPTGLKLANGLRSPVIVNAAEPTGEGPGDAFSIEPAGQSGLGVEGGVAGLESYYRRQLVWVNFG